MGHAIHGIGPVMPANEVIDPNDLTDEQLLALFPEFKAFLAELYQSVIHQRGADAAQTHNEAATADTATAPKSA